MPEQEKITTLDRLAVAIQKDFARMDEAFGKVHAELATKPSVAEVRNIVRQETQDIRDDVTMIKTTMATKADIEHLREELILEINHGDRAVKTETRLIRLEKKAGIALDTGRGG